MPKVHRAANAFFTWRRNSTSFIVHCPTSRNLDRAHKYLIGTEKADKRGYGRCGDVELSDVRRSGNERQLALRALRRAIGHSRVSLLFWLDVRGVEVLFALRG